MEQKPKMPPEQIFLQNGGDGYDPETWEGATWCQDRIEDSDVKYIRADLAPPVEASAAQGVREILDKVIVGCQDVLDAPTTDLHPSYVIDNLKTALALMGSSKPSLPSPTDDMKRLQAYILKNFTCEWGRHESITDVAIRLLGATVDSSAAKLPGEARPHSSSPVTPGIPTQRIKDQAAIAAYLEFVLDLDGEAAKTYADGILILLEPGPLVKPPALPETGMREALQTILDMIIQNEGLALIEIKRIARAALSQPAETGVAEALAELCDRVERGRNLVKDMCDNFYGKSSPENNNWGVFDTSKARAALQGPGEGRCFAGETDDPGCPHGYMDRMACRKCTDEYFTVEGCGCRRFVQHGPNPPGESDQ